jgi:hypothetical protein
MVSKPCSRLVVARVTASVFPHRLAAVYSGHRRYLFLFGSQSERERYVAELVAEGASAVESTVTISDTEAERAA